MKRSRGGGRGADRPPGGRPAVLAVDIGNSRISIGVVRAGRVRALRHLPSRPHAAAAIARALRATRSAAGPRAQVARAALCSVVPRLVAPWRRVMADALGVPVRMVDARALRSMPIRYRDPGAVGPDRLANALAARAHYGAPAIVVDFGTATNFDCVGADGAFLGGVIAPGVTTAAEALYVRAARLPRVALAMPRRALGRTTAGALRAGIVLGAAAMVDGLVRRLARDMNVRPHVIATGGVARRIVRACRTVSRVDETLTMKGIALIWEESVAAGPSRSRPGARRGGAASSAPRGRTASRRKGKRG